mgnify:CR=1 FL=1
MGSSILPYPLPSLLLGNQVSQRIRQSKYGQVRGILLTQQAVVVRTEKRFASLHCSIVNNLLITLEI